MTLELRGITKRFGSFTANNSIDLTLEPGEIVALLGENGAGKTTLMNVLYGLYQADEGEIIIDGKVQHFADPGDAMDAGIGMVHQHFMLIPVFTVAENLMLGHEQTKALGILDIGAARNRVREISARFGFDLNPDALVEDLPVGVQQRVEIIKALSRDARFLVFDEPTAVLTPQETDELMEIMRELKAQGTSIIFITHKLREVREVADRIVVIRRGEVVGEALPTDSREHLANLMVGRAVNLTVGKEPAQPGEVTLDVSGLSVIDPRGQLAVDDVTFQVRAGEIVCVAGVQGNGQSELAEALIGLQTPAAGSVRLRGHDLTGKSVRTVLDAGVGFVPEDRSHEGLVAEFTIAENLILDRPAQAPFVRFATLQKTAIDAFATEAVERFDIRTSGIDNTASQLSGGNQQKVVIARELSRELTFLLASQPTRGVDVGSIQFIHEQIVAARDAGCAVLVVSSELDEVAALADRIIVMYHGQIVGIVPPDTPREEIGLLMAGSRQETDAAS